MAKFLAGFGGSVARVAAVLLVGAMSVACGAADETIPVEASQDLRRPVPITSAEYRFDAAEDPDVIEGRATEIWARVYRPATLRPHKRYPLLVFLHGNHGTCGTGENPRFDSTCEYTDTGVCPDGFVVSPNHEGYAYVGERLAAQQYIVVSINANRGITCAFGASGDSFLIFARARLILKHLQRLSEWNAGVEATPPSLGVSLENHLDFSEVGLMGHSRGGEGIRSAYELYREAGSPWPGRILEPTTFRGLFEIGPVDGQAPQTVNADGARWAVLLPQCDGDVANLAGQRPFDRMMYAFAEDPQTMKAQYTVWGANHNFYNTEWQVSDAVGCAGHEPLFETGGEVDPNVGMFIPGVTGSADQRETGRTAMEAFFFGSVGNLADPQRLRFFDPLFPLPGDLTELTKLERGFTPTPHTDVTLVLEDFLGDTGTSTYGLPNAASGITISHGSIPEHDFALRGATISWPAAGAGVFFQSNWAAAGSGFDLRNRTVDFRVDRALSTLNVDEATNFSVQLVRSNDTLCPRVRVADYLDLEGPGGGQSAFFSGDLFHSPLQTARIPISDFRCGDVRRIRGIRFTFDATASGELYLGNVRAERCERGHHGIDCGARRPRHPRHGHHRGGHGPGRHGHLAAASLPADNQIVSVRPVNLGGSTPQAVVEIELASSVRFVPRNSALLLHVGDVTVDLSGHPGGDTRRVIFRATPEQAASFSAGAPVRVDYGPASAGWDFGGWPG